MNESTCGKVQREWTFLSRFVLVTLVIVCACGSPLPEIGTAEQAVFTCPSLASIPPAHGGDPFERLDPHGTVRGGASVTPRGGFRYTLPIWTPPTRAGLAPSLSLVYDSQRGAGIAGVGWSLNGQSKIQRCRKFLAREGEVRGVNYEDSHLPFEPAGDSYCLDGKLLVPDYWETTPPLPASLPTPLGSARIYQEFRTEHDDFARIIAFGTEEHGPLNWVVLHPSGRFDFYGEGSAQGTGWNLATSQNERLIWYRSRSVDRSRNLIEYTYIADPGALGAANRLLSEITYGHGLSGSSYVNASKRKVELVYGQQGWRSRWVSGVETVTTQRLERVRVHAPVRPGDPPTLAKEYRMSYQLSARTARPLLTSFEECGPYGNCLPAPRSTIHSPPIPAFTGTLPRTGVWFLRRETSQIWG